MNSMLKLASVALFASVVMTGPVALAQDKAKDAKGSPTASAGKGNATTKVLVDNDKFLVTETTYRPGEVGAEDRSHYRINRTLQGGMLQRNYPDGKTETFEVKTGQVRYLEPSKGGNYTVKNIGKTTYVSYVVRIK